MNDLWKEDADTPEVNVPDTVKRELMLAELAEYFREEERPPGSITAKEAAEQLGKSVDVVRKVLERKVDAGEYKKKKMRLDGRMQWVFWKE